jgi:hypothetical protein
VKRWALYLGLTLFAVLLWTVASAGKPKFFDLDDAQTIERVSIHNADDFPAPHMHFVITCDLCGTVTDVLVFLADDDKTYSATFPNHGETGQARSRRGINAMILEFELRECLRECGQSSPLGLELR